MLQAGTEFLTNNLVKIFTRNQISSPPPFLPTSLKLQNKTSQQNAKRKFKFSTISNGISSLNHGPVENRKNVYKISGIYLK